MDFLVLFLVFLAVFGLLSLVCLWQGAHICNNYYVAWMLQKLSQVTIYIVPKDLRNFVQFLVSYTFYERNHLFQGIYIVLVILGHWFLLFDTIPLLYAYNMDKNHVFAPMLHLVINTFLFGVCCYSDPGIIKEHNYAKYANAYAYDGVMYRPGVTCPTCNFVKPARSKHCAFTDWCIHRFDHFCPWTNNAVGGLNHRYFLALLISITVMAGNASWMAYRALQSITQSSQLWSAQYLDKEGVAQPMNFRVLTQTLFMKLPTVVFLGAALTVITIMVGGFTLYHVYLVITAQTTNERYKKHRLNKDQRMNLDCYYSTGLFRNLYEEIFPNHFLSNCVKTSNHEVHCKKSSGNVKARNINGLKKRKR